MSLLYYIKVQYNNIPFYAMVDCGAQISIMSLTMVKKLGITDVKPINGVVKGIGQTKMLGKVKNCPLSIVNQTMFIPILIDFIVLHMNGNKVPLIKQPIKSSKSIVKKPVSKKTTPKAVNK
jgi:hypothetical protein